MLRVLLGQPPRNNTGALAEAMAEMNGFAASLRSAGKSRAGASSEYRELEVWTLGLIRSLDELEQSWFAASYYRKLVKTGYVEDLTVTEQEDYARYVYFYKNGFIRVFSLLDKLGTVLNAMYELNTSKVKAHYSYFTVLRQFRFLKVHGPLIERLEEIKDEYRDPLQQLRKRRNAEIHYMNSEMEDDLWQRRQGLSDRIRLENMDSHLNDLKQGLEMVCRTLAAAFRYSNGQWSRHVHNAGNR